MIEPDGPQGTVTSLNDPVGAVRGRSLLLHLDAVSEAERHASGQGQVAAHVVPANDAEVCVAKTSDIEFKD